MAANKNTQQKATGQKTSDSPNSRQAPPVAELPKGKGTQDDAPPPSNPSPIPRGKGVRTEREHKGDVHRLPQDKARWAYGTSVADTAELLREQRQIDADNK